MILIMTTMVIQNLACFKICWTEYRLERLYCIRGAFAEAALLHSRVCDPQQSSKAKSVGAATHDAHSAFEEFLGIRLRMMLANVQNPIVPYIIIKYSICITL